MTALRAGHDPAGRPASHAGPEVGGVFVLAVATAVFACTDGSAAAHAFTNSNRIPWPSPAPASIQAGLVPAA